MYECCDEEKKSKKLFLDKHQKSSQNEQNISSLTLSAVISIDHHILEALWFDVLPHGTHSLNHLKWLHIRHDGKLSLTCSKFSICSDDSCDRSRDILGDGSVPLSLSLFSDWTSKQKDNSRHEISASSLNLSIFVCESMSVCKHAYKHIHTHTYKWGKMMLVKLQTQILTHT